MILTTCAACAAPLAHDAPHCVRCWVRYCDKTIRAAYNYASSLKGLQRLEEAKTLLRKNIPVARRIFGESDAYTLRFRWLYANCLCDYKNATFDDVAEAVETLESVAKVWKRFMGERHPETAKVLNALKEAREMLRLRREASD
jgi:hypothetical protein